MAKKSKRYKKRAKRLKSLEVDYGDSAAFFWSKLRVSVDRGWPSLRMWVRSQPCVFCGVWLDVSEMTVDHIQPKSKGGGGGYRNFAPACQPCNQAKGNQSLLMFLLFRE